MNRWIPLAVLALVLVVVQQTTAECRDRLDTCERAAGYCKSPALQETLRRNCEKTCGHCTTSGGSKKKAKRTPKKRRNPPRKKPAKKPKRKPAKKPAKKQPEPKFTLHYFDFRFRGEPARMLFHYKGVNFTDFKVEPRTQWPAIKASYPNGQVPLLQVDKQNISQSMSIYRFLGHRFGLAGKDATEQAHLDEVSELFRDCLDNTTRYIQVKFVGFPGNERQLHDDAFVPSLKTYGPQLEKFLDEAKSGFFAASGVSWVDFYVAGIVKTYLNADATEMAKYPKLKAHCDKVYALPQLKGWLAKEPPGNF
ncbi:Glutathione S-transferase 1 [Aphelenchoides fujianensis]|nr:Glutathione S-transferase 1 [Aphelenchoides fujianensis]